MKKIMLIFCTVLTLIFALAISDSKIFMEFKGYINGIFLDSAFESTVPALRESLKKGEYVFQNNSKDLNFLQYVPNLEAPKENAKTVISLSLAPDTSEGFKIKNTSGKAFDISELSNKKLDKSLFEKSDGPLVLVYHTHGSEAFNLYNGEYYYGGSAERSLKTEENMIGIGKSFVKFLSDNGISAIQITDIFDYPVYSGSYARAKVEIDKILKKYPSIKYIIDLHRDSIINENGEKYRPVISIGGQKAAQIMFVVGTGSDTVINDHWEDNLSLAIRLNKKIESKYPNLCRTMLVRKASYNAEMSKGALLIEMGACGNTYLEVEHSAKLLAKCFGEFINEGQN